MDEIRLRMRVGWRRGIFVSFLMFDVTVMICISMYYCPMRAAVAFLHRPKKQPKKSSSAKSLRVSERPRFFTFYNLII